MPTCGGGGHVPCFACRFSPRHSRTGRGRLDRTRLAPARAGGGARRRRADSKPSRDSLGVREGYVQAGDNNIIKKRERLRENFEGCSTDTSRWRRGLLVSNTWPLPKNRKAAAAAGFPWYRISSRHAVNGENTTASSLSCSSIPSIAEPSSYRLHLARCT